MEENRLKVMKPYDVSLFNDIYQKVSPLKKKLASEIDCRRFGVDYDEICSWFDVKLIYTFNKYQDTKPDLLLGYVINSLKMMKFRILRSAYTEKFSQSITRMEDYHLDLNADEIVEPTDKYNKLIAFMKSHLSENAYELLTIQLNPPPYIINKMAAMDLSSSQKIPDAVILDYYGIGDCHESARLLKYWKKEIKHASELAKVYFSKA